MATVLYINGEKVDITGEWLKLSLTYQYDDLDDLETSKNSHSQTIQLPATAQIKRLFRFPDDINSGDFKGQKTELFGEIYEDDQKIFSGVVSLISVTEGGDE